MNISSDGLNEKVIHNILIHYYTCLLTLNTYNNLQLTTYNYPKVDFYRSKYL